MLVGQTSEYKSHHGVPATFHSLPIYIPRLCCSLPKVLLLLYLPPPLVRFLGLMELAAIFESSHFLFLGQRGSAVSGVLEG